MYREPILRKYSSSVILEDYQEDVDLEECERTHQKLAKQEDQGNMNKELDDFENKKE